MEITELRKIVQESYSIGLVLKKIGWGDNGNYRRKLKCILADNDIDYSHFDVKTALSILYTKWPKIVKVCPVCGEDFITQFGHKREKTVCSISCSNTFFRSGENNPNWKDIKSVGYSSYRLAFIKQNGHLKCAVCGENKIVAVHHYDENHENNSIENLIPMCPTHHCYWHSRYKSEVVDVVEKYRINIINRAPAMRDGVPLDNANTTCGKA